MTRTIRSISVAAAVAVLLVASVASAQRGPNEKKAAAHFKQGKAYMDLQLYDKAVAEFEQAYELVPRALILFHVGRAYHLSGNHEQALENYRRFIADQPDGKVADEARGYIAEVEKAIADEKARAAEEEKRKQEEERKQREAEQENIRREAGAHVERARGLMDEGKYTEAAAEFAKAHDIDSNPELWFDIAEAQQRAGDKRAARDSYTRYTEEAPPGPRAGAAREQIDVLTREIELGDTGGGSGGGGGPIDAPPKQKSKINWVWVGVGAAAIAAGVVADVVPDSSSNGTLDAMDFAGAALYGVGASLVLVGVF